MDGHFRILKTSSIAPALVALAAISWPVHALQVGPSLDLGLAFDGSVSVVHPLGDGRLVIGGSFESVRGHASEGIAMLEPDGRGVPTFVPRCRGVATRDAPPACVVSRIASAHDGSLIVAGSFAGFGPVNREGLAKLDADTGAADPAWNPFAWIAAGPVVDMASIDGRVILVLGGVNPRVVAVSEEGAGLPLAGAPTIPLAGSLPTLAPPNHLYLATGPTNAQRARRFSLDTGLLDPNWESRAFERIEAMAWDATSRSLLVAGAEPFAGNVQGRMLVRIGSQPSAPEWTPWNTTQFSVSRFRGLRVAGNWLFADACQSVFSDCAIRRLALDGFGQFDPSYAGTVLFGYRALLAVEPAGRALLSIDNFGLPSAAPDGSRLVRLTAQGAVDGVFRPGVRSEAEVTFLARSRSGDIAVHGFFQWAGDLPADKVVRLRRDADRLADWRPFGPSCDPSVCESVTAMAIDQGHHVFVGTRLFNDGDFGTFPSLRRFQPEGAPFEDWHPRRVIGEYVDLDAGIVALAVDDANGWLYLGGRFEGDVCGQPRRNLARVTLAAPCRADPDWQPDPDGVVESLAVDAQGRLVVGGSFRNISGQPIAHLARFDGPVLDTAWRPIATTAAMVSVPKLAVTPDFVFAEVRQSLPGSSPATGLLRFAVGVSPAPANWAPPPADRIDALVAATGGQLLAVRRGVVPTPFGTPVDRIEVFAGAGTGTPTATLPLMPGQNIRAAALRADGGILIGGRFDRIGTAERATLATLYLDPIQLFASSFE